MSKKSRVTKQFINHLFGLYRVHRIPVYVHYHHDFLVTDEGDTSYGLFCYGDGMPECIHVAAGKTGLFHTLTTVAHEFCHYLQWLHGRDMSDGQIEIDAMYYEGPMVGAWYINKKSKNEHCYGAPPVWEPHVEVMDDAAEAE